MVPLGATINLEGEGPEYSLVDGFVSRRTKGGESGGRLTIIIQEGAGIPLRFSANEVLELVKGDLTPLCLPVAWPMLFPWFANTIQELTHFWKSYCTPQAEKERLRACFGNVSADRIKAKLARNLSAKIDLEAPEPDSRLLLLGRYLADSLINNPEEVRFFSEAVNKEGANSRGGPFSDQGIVFGEFVKFIGQHWRLPSKKELDGLSKLEARVAIRARGKLGLGGLPHSNVVN